MALTETLTLERGSWRAGALSTCAAAFLFMAYCQAHGLLDASPVPLDASLRWGLLAGGPAGGLAWLIWVQRRQITAFASRGITLTAALIGGLFVLLIVGGAATHFVAARRFDNFAARMADDAFDLIPLAAAVAAGAAALLVANLRSGSTAQGSTIAPAWLTVPEAPNLRLRTRDVATIRAAGNYCELQTASRAYLVRVPVKVLAERLQAAHFVRIHRSMLVNLERVQTVECLAGQIRVRLDDDSLQPVGHTYRAGLERALATHSSRPDAFRP